MTSAADRLTRHLECAIESWPLRVPFVTSMDVVKDIEVVFVQIHADGTVGRGEAIGVPFRGETAASLASEITRVRPFIENGASKEDLQGLLHAGGARNALDCALWDLEAKMTGVPVAARIGVPIAPVRTVATIGLDEPQRMAARARSLGNFAILKIKVGRDNPLACAQAVRAARPEVRLIVDANGAWSVGLLADIAPRLADLGVEMIEQPLASACDRLLRQAHYPIPLCADESCHTRDDIERLVGRYSMLNIKLDKTGGLTEALALAQAARAAGFDLMVGNMIGTSLAMAPACLLAHGCRFADLDGALLLETDRTPGMELHGDFLDPARAELWGAPADCR